MARQVPPPLEGWPQFRAQPVAASVGAGDGDEVGAADGGDVGAAVGLVVGGGVGLGVGGLVVSVVVIVVVPVVVSVVVVLGGDDVGAVVGAAGTQIETRMVSFESWTPLGLKRSWVSSEWSAM